MTRVQLRPMTVDDIPRVLEIERQSFRTPWPSDAYFHELKENRLAAYIVAKVDDRLVGYAGMWVILDEAHITTIAVEPALRGQKVGERLLVGLIDAALERGARWMTLEVRKSNLTAQNLYRKYGFREIGTRKGYYSDNREDAIVMWTGNLREREFQERLARLRQAMEAD
ncbi:MAG: ribosomal protein S18-alanine N-acetyltransferase [Armatimonadota bacterium]|nr:ribosomal protein S18-alanine N-acetyltransferase [Armatimonadota bacterium]MDR7452594.1 ribosomal protein S18-alanine N-acetyltransferase [Armatimonadota bacterium]MDR7468245.1 ribosomal protein S18-alanine N-acetyltransferase [Armatimonadota bacterium]MDR7495239.1 ribosomal protein S18-alanine N-acetyltransferase [Armatimonadota bacterium]MDR7500486.1 ribosomal protein S18-alanine N-acetyltransferase [Armatimonadota bacterium]